jgi:hypothetical protein
MANITEVVSQIRFGLEQLSPRNAHHEFEHLCRHLARARICSNILPATGPVAAGGDQGRDFETFRTYLSASPIANSTFIGLVSSKPIGFACSLEKKGTISRKIKSDVTTIVSSGSVVDAVHFFAVANITLAIRHKLQAWAMSTHHVELEIHDGNAISELLADREVFWIAVTFLSIPAEIFPRASESDDDRWYESVLSRWKDQKPTGKNSAEFSEIKLAARLAFLNERLRQDLPFWITLIEKTFLDSPITNLRRRAIYEVCFLNLRGLNSLEGYEGLLRDYFSTIPNLSSATDLEDARNLVSYCTGALGHGVVGLTIQEVSDWQHSLIQRIDELLKETVHPNVEASLLGLKGWMFLIIDPVTPRPFDFEMTIEWWMKLADVVDSAPMFPLQRFADNATELLELILEINPKTQIPANYFQLTEKLDDLLAKRLGGFTAAENSLKRASVLHDQGRVLDAIDLLHRSKLDWYASETLREALSTMLFLSRAYMQLGLLFAAKYYALAVAFIAINNTQPSVRPYASRGLMRAATWDYILGAFCGFLNLTDIEIPIHQAHARDAGDLEKNTELHSIVFHLVMLKAISERVNPDFDHLVSTRIEKWLPKEWVDGILPEARQSLAGMDDEQLKEHLASELLGMPYDDLGPQRKVAWSALGVRWSAMWKNDYATTKEAEQFVAILQVYLVEIARHDLCLLKTSVHISLELVDSGAIEIHPIPSNSGRIWKVLLPRSGVHSPADLGKTHIDVFSAVDQILLEISLLPESGYLEIMKSLFKRGLANRIFVAHPYEAVYGEFIQQDDFNQFDRNANKNPFGEFNVPVFEHKELRWNNSPGPTYDRSSAEQALKNRYERIMPSIRYTLPRLLEVPRFRRTIANLRQKGWLDWHILTAVSGATMNERLNREFADEHDPERVTELYRGLSEEKEEWEPVPLNIFEEGVLLFCLYTNMPSTLKGLELECHQLTPDFEGIEEFLRHRYNYWTDDLPHSDPFSISKKNAVREKRRRAVP